MSADSLKPAVMVPTDSEKVIVIYLKITRTSIVSWMVLSVLWLLSTACYSIIDFTQSFHVLQPASFINFLSAGPGLALCYRPPAVVEIYIYASPRVHSSHTRWLLASALGTTITNYTENPCPPHQTALIIHHKAASIRLHQGQPGHPIHLFPCTRERTERRLQPGTGIQVRSTENKVRVYLRLICLDPSVYLYFFAPSMMTSSLYIFSN
jgi:hypothetical protein